MTPAMMHHPSPHEDGGMLYSTSELNDPEYSTDDFRMFSFKVARCSKRYVHDWRSCPFAHPTENARRRDPRTTRYLPVPCPDYKRGICMRGDTCPYSHGVYECWLHPAKYRTQLCKEGPSCHRPVCFFAHSVGHLRQPTHLWNGNSSEEAIAAMSQPPSAAAALILQAPVSEIEAKRSESDAARRLVAAEEAFNNMQEQSVFVESPSFITAAAAVSGSSPPPPTSAMLSMMGGESSQVDDDDDDDDAGIVVAAVVDDTPIREAETETMMMMMMRSRSPEAPASVQDAGTPCTPPHESDPFACSTDAADGASLAAASSLPLETAKSVEVVVQQQQQQSVAITINSDNSSSSSSLTETATAADKTAPTTEKTATRHSLDNSMQFQAATVAAQSAPPNWSQGLAASATAAAALVGVPVNEQPMLPNHGPRMSNAVARKLGLAPVKPASETTTPATVGAAGTPTATVVGAGTNNGNSCSTPNALTSPSPQSLSMDINHPSALRVQQHQQAFQNHNTSLDDVRLSHAVALANSNAAAAAAAAAAANLVGMVHGGGGGFPAPLPHHHQFAAPANLVGGGGYGSSNYPVGSADALGIHPALLNLVAANMANSSNGGGGGVNGNGLSTSAMLHHQQQQQQQQQQQHLFAFTGHHEHQGGYGDASGIASLLGHMSQWGLGECGSGDSSSRGDTSVHSSQNSGGGGGMSFIPHRTSSENMLGTSGLPQVRNE